MSHSYSQLTKDERNQFYAWRKAKITNDEYLASTTPSHASVNTFQFASLTLISYPNGVEAYFDLFEFCCCFSRRDTLRRHSTKHDHRLE